MYVVYGAEWCNYCKIAKAYLEDRGINFDYVDVDEKQFEFQEIIDTYQVRTLPQIFEVGEDNLWIHIGGYEDLVSHVSS